MAKRNQNKPTPPVIKPKDLNKEVGATVKEAAKAEQLAIEKESAEKKAAEEAAKAEQLADVVEELGGDPNAKGVNKTPDELRAMVDANVKSNPNGEPPAYVTGDGMVFAKNRYANAVEHTKGKKGLKLFHVEELMGSGK